MILAGVPAGTQVGYGLFAPRSLEVGAYAAQPTDPGATKVTLIVQDSTVAYAVRALAHAAHLKISFDNANPLFSRRINVHLIDVSVLEAITAALKGTGLMARLAPDGETIVVSPSASATTGGRRRLAGGVIAGQVTDSTTGGGLKGAQVRVEGVPKLSAVTTDSGNFILRNVPLGDQVLEVRLFGYRAVARTVTVVDGERTTVRVVMVPVPTVLSGVVTTAAGMQRKIEVGNDITTINVDSVMRVAPVSTVTDLLNGRVPGLIVTTASGIPGAPVRVRIRGVSSVTTSSDPIVIVDGVRVYADQSGSPGAENGAVSVPVTGGSQVGSVSGGGTYHGPSPLNQIDPASIETIEVLKGPSASALYGSDAANGVIVITTKRGKPGPTRWDLALDQGWTMIGGQWPINYYCFGHQEGSGVVIGGSTDGQCYPYVSYTQVDSVVAYQALRDSRFSPLKTGVSRDASLTVSGGSGALTYAVTGSGTQTTGVLRLPAIEAQRFATSHGFPAPAWMERPDQYDTWGGNSRLDWRLGQTGGMLSLTNKLFRSTQQQSSLNAGQVLSNLAGSYISLSALNNTPLIADYYNRAQLTSLTSTNGVTLTYPVRSWLPITATAGIDLSNLRNSTVTPRDYILNTPDSVGGYSLASGNTITQSLNVGTTIPLPGVSVAGGLNVYTTERTDFGASTIGLPIGVMEPTQFFYPAGGGPQQSKVDRSTYGYYVAPTFNFLSRLFVSPGFRLDGGSGGSNVSGNSLSLFPKIDLSYLAVNRTSHDEAPLLGMFTLVRPRIAFGIAGVQPGPAEQLRLFEPDQVVPIGGSVPVPIANLVSLGNTQLHPERSRELEGGLDLELWSQRLTVTLTGYNKTRYDAILSIPVAPSISGFGNSSLNEMAENVGTIRNRGINATATANILESRALAWNVTGLVQKDYNRVLSVAPGLSGLPLQFGTDVQLRAGYPLYGLFVKPILGFSDVNHDGIIEPSEVRVGDSVAYIGQNAVPNYEMDLSTTLTLLDGRLSVNTAVQYQNGLTQNNGASTNQSGFPGNILSPLALALYNPATSPAQQAAIAASFGGLTNMGVYQTVNVTRWSTLSVNYVLPQAAARWFGASSMSLALQGSNLALHSNYRGKDPDVNAFTNGNLTADTGQLPQPRLWTLRVTLGR